MLPFIGIILLLLVSVIWLTKPEKTALGKVLCNSDFQTNQFNQRQAVGELALTTNPNANVMTVVWQPGGTGTMVPGSGVLLDDLGASDYSGIAPLIDKRAADANPIEGILIADTKKATKDPGDVLSIAKQGTVIWMLANAAILRGAKLALVLAKPGYVVTLTAEALCGKALDKATAQDDLIRVEILANGVV